MENETKAEETKIPEVIPPKNGRKSPKARATPASKNDNSNTQKAPLTRARGGPRTPMGKERSRRNALKHRILARTVVLEGESRIEFDSLLQGLRADLQPSGTVENLLVEKLASLAWRYRRLLVTEKAEIQLGARFNVLSAERENLNRQEALTLFSSVEESPGPGLLSKFDNPIIGNRCIELLETLKTTIKFRGFHSDDEFLIKMLFGVGAASEFRLLYFLIKDAGTPASVLKELDALPEGRRAAFLELLEYYIRRLEHRLELNEDRSDREKGMEIKCSGVPEASRLDRMLRYEAALERAFDRTLNQLERLQRMRLGQPVSPPININVSNS